MLEDLASAQEISNATNQLLRKADALYRLPTPVDDLVEAAGLTVAGTSVLTQAQLALAPPHISVVLRRVAGKVQGLLDRTTREVHLHPSVENDGHGRFVRVHEISHDIFSWQRDLVYADTELMLSPMTRQLFECEANQGASELLFQGDVFQEVAAQYDIGMGAVIDLSEKFGASIRATLRRFAETHRDTVLAIVLERQPCSTNPLAFRRREASGSGKWRARFGNPARWPNGMTVASHPLIAVAAAGNGHTSWQSSIALPDGAGDSTDLAVEVVDNSYNLLVLAWIPVRRPRLARRRRTLAAKA